MHTVRIYRLDHLSPTLFQRLKAAQMEAAAVWNACSELHKAARTMQSRWPGQEQSDGVPGRDPPGGCDHQHRGGHRHLRPWDTQSQTPEQHTAPATGEETSPLP